LAADAAGFFTLVFLCFLTLLFLVACLAFLALEVGVVAAAEAVAPAAVGTAGACANETAATPDSNAAAIRDLILNMIRTHSKQLIVAAAPTILSEPKYFSGLQPQRLPIAYVDAGHFSLQDLPAD
jgi:hypothetical protein